VLRRAVEDRGPAAVRLAARALGQLEPDDLAPLARVAEDDELRELRVPARDLVELRADSVGAVVVGARP
jgi:hypothetical protein